MAVKVAYSQGLLTTNNLASVCVYSVFNRERQSANLRNEIYEGNVVFTEVYLEDFFLDSVFGVVQSKTFGSLSNNDGDGYENVTQKVKSRCFKLYRAYSMSLNLSYVGNRPFYQHGGHIELIRFKEYYRMLRGHEHISFVFSSAFRDVFS